MEEDDTVVKGSHKDSSAKRRNNKRKGDKHRRQISEVLDTLQDITLDEAKETLETMLSNATDAEIKAIESEIAVSMPSEITPGSAQEYMFGCLSDQTETLNACTPQCHDGFKPSKIKNCNLTVYEKKNDKVKCHHKVEGGNSAYLYFANNEKVKLTSIERRQMVSDGIREVFVYKQRKQSVDYEHVDTWIFKRRRRKNRVQDNNNSKYIILIVIVLFILIAAAYVQRSRRNSYRKKLTC